MLLVLMMTLSLSLSFSFSLASSLLPFQGPWLPHDPEDAVVFQFVTGTPMHRDGGGGVTEAVHRQHRLTVCLCGFQRPSLTFSP